MKGKIKRSSADGHLSNCVRMAATINGELRPWHCQLCETDYSDRNRQGIQCSHFIGRGVTMHGTHGWATRFDPLNCLSLCAACHGYVESHPVAHTNLWRDTYGSVYGADKSDAALNALLKRSECKSRAQYARNNTAAISTWYLEESRRLEVEIENFYNGKESDFEIRSYVPTRKPLEISG